MFTSLSLLIVLSSTAGSAAASTDSVSTASVSTHPADRALRLYPSTADLLLAENTRIINVTTAPSDGAYMLTIAGDALGGALVGFLIGGALFLLQAQNNRRPVNLAWWIGGGTLVGVGAGVVQVVVSVRRDEAAIGRLDGIPDNTRRMFGWSHGF